MTTTITHSNIASHYTDLPMLYEAADFLKPYLSRGLPELKEIIIAISYNPILSAMHDAEYIAETSLSPDRQELKIVVVLIAPPLAKMITEAVTLQLTAAKMKVIAELAEVA